ncbi:PQQ-binding-like beta-propeller repeat protein [Microbacter sp. GSS18]|nr:PQQ-binding-like beta-propeller repeat protein [Microbacter sp. GSS18]
MSWMKSRAMLLAIAGIAAVVLIGGPASAAPGGAGWNSAGGDRSNTRHAASESKISPATVADLSLKWVLNTGGDVSATPAVDGDRVYVPDWAGNLYAVDRSTGAVVWQRQIEDYTGVPRDASRTSPAFTDTTLVIGDKGATSNADGSPSLGNGGRVIAVDKQTGDVRWVTQVETHFAAVITQSPTIFDGVVYVGVSSVEEGLAGLIPGYECCTFRGSLAALDLETGAILWKTYMAPEGYPGASVWGSSPAVDPKRGSVYVATGNNYAIPADALACVEAAGDDPDAQQACLPPDDYFDAIVALDMTTGAVKWVTRALPYDTWTWACLFGAPSCPTPTGPDYDFGQAPALFKVKNAGGGPRELLGAGQKSGQYWALDPATGAVVWVTDTGPGGINGGLQWGSAVDGKRVYTANANSDQVPYPTASDPTTGIWSALDAATGEILWQTRPPNGGGASGPATTANGVVFGCTNDADGWMYALDAATGEVLWSFESGGSCVSGAAISNGMVFWGSGYGFYGGAFGTPSNKLYAFDLG